MALRGWRATAHGAPGVQRRRTASDSARRRRRSMARSAAGGDRNLARSAASGAIDGAQRSRRRATACYMRDSLLHERQPATTAQGDAKGGAAQRRRAARVACICIST
eukprot:479852-Pleurochrysis_carterae.AAC.1